MKLDTILGNPVGVFIVVTAALFVIALPFVITSSIRKHLRKKAIAKRDENLRREFAIWKQNVGKIGSLPQVQTSLIMKKGEFCYFCCTGSVLYEVRSVRTSSFAGASQRLGHGFTVGGGSSYSTSQDSWRALAVGTLTMTNMRVYFNGDKQDRNVVLREIRSIDFTPTTIELSCEKRQHSMVFSVSNGLKASYILQVLVANNT